MLPGEPSAVFPQQCLLERHLLKDDSAPQNEIASICLKGESSVTTSPSSAWGGTGAEQNNLLCTFQWCHEHSPARLFPYCQTQTSQRIWDFLQNITIHRKQRKKKGSFSKAWFSTRNFLLEAQIFFFPSLLKKCPPSFSLLSNTTCFPILQNIWVSVSGC